jgi:uncharacterized RDD family membrane protein YckC
MNNNRVPLKINGINENIYAGFWLRVWAQILDAVFVLPVLFLLLYLNGLDKNMYFYTLIPSMVFMLWYNVYLPQKNGGTPGKFIAGLTIIRIDGNYIGWKEAGLLYIVVFTLSVFNMVMMSANLLKADEVTFMGLGWLKRSQYLMSFSPDFFKITSWLTNLWVLGEYIVLFTNKRKRMTGDFIAGTVVVKTQYLEAIETEMNKCID